MKDDFSIQEKALDIAYEHAPNLILIVDHNFRVERINRIGVETIGKDPKDILGFALGTIFSCVNSFGGDGCGTNHNCVTCSIRAIIAESFRLGSDFHKIEGSMDTLSDDGVVSIHKFLVSTVYVSSQDNDKVLLYLDDVTERKKAEKTIKESEERFHALYENIPGGTMIIGKDYTIEDVNQRTCEVTGYEKEELIGQSCDILFPGCSLSRQCPLSEDDLDGVQCMDTTIICKDGTKVPILKNTKKIFINGEKYILGILEDISDLKEAERATADAMFLAEEANRIKSEFIANMSHELRTPLNAVIGYSDLLLEESFGVLGSQQKKSLNHISNSGRHLLKLINDILDISKVESGKMELYYEDFFASEMFMTVLNIISPLARKKNIKLESSIVPDNLLVNADKIRFKQILFNLASNAVKFTSDGGSVLLKAHKRDDIMKFSVIDTGIGISSDDVGRLFLPFQQIDSTISREYDGTGLGLSLVKKFVEMHGGMVSVESEPGQGSNFSFSIPLGDKH
ncbi:ATP-binding protein [Methanolobus sp. ZRKC4]|uniref:PAS domain-containing sensor histidine kinase n=1 Tax=Methanolobus sp. ZRKC4 TaxID=3125787 RepID=UPI0032522652